MDMTSIALSNSPDRHLWIQAYERSAQLRDLLLRLRAGYDCHPYTLSEDGLLYAYVQDPRSALEVSKLVPPEGEIRDGLIQDTVAELKVTQGTKIDEGLAEKVLKSLSEEYWWEDMDLHVRQIAR
jgi:hypothetical protein